MKKRKRATIVERHRCNDRHEVLSIEGRGTYRREPCQECPWRLDAPVGRFPVEAFRHSANTCHDAALRTFACHMSGADKPATCAGFLLSRSAIHNVAVRVGMSAGRLDLDQVSSTVPLYGDYRAMAIANGVDPDDPSIKLVRVK